MELTAKHVTIVLKTASTLTSFDLIWPQKFKKLLLALCDYEMVGATSSFPDTDFVVYQVCTSTLSSLKWKRHCSVLVKHDLLEIKSVHCLTLTAALNWGSMPGTWVFIHVSFPFKFQAFWRIGWIVIYWNCGPVQVVGLGGYVWKPSFGKWCFSDPRNPTLKRTWPKSRHTHCGQKQGMGSVKNRMEMVGFRSSWFVLGAQWDTCAGHRIHFDAPACIQAIVFH